MPSIVSDETLNQKIAELDELNRKLAYWTQEKQRLEDRKSIVKAHLMKFYEKKALEGDKKSLSAQIQERDAKCDERYKAACDEYATACGKQTYYYQAVKQFEPLWNIWRSEKSSERLEQNLYGS